MKVTLDSFVAILTPAHREEMAKCLGARPQPAVPLPEADLLDTIKVGDHGQLLPVTNAQVVNMVLDMQDSDSAMPQASSSSCQVVNSTPSASALVEGTPQTAPPGANLVQSASNQSGRAMSQFFRVRMFMSWQESQQSWPLEIPLNFSVSRAGTLS